MTATSSRAVRHRGLQAPAIPRADTNGLEPVMHPERVPVHPDKSDVVLPSERSNPFEIWGLAPHQATAWGQQFQFGTPYMALVRDWVSVRARRIVADLCNVVQELPPSRGKGLDHELWILHRAYTTIISPEAAKRLCFDPGLMMRWKESFVNYDNYRQEMTPERQLMLPALAEALQCHKYPLMNIDSLDSRLGANVREAIQALHAAPNDETFLLRHWGSNAVAFIAREAQQPCGPSCQKDLPCRTCSVAAWLFIDFCHRYGFS